MCIQDTMSLLLHFLTWPILCFVTLCKAKSGIATCFSTSKRILKVEVMVCGPIHTCPYCMFNIDTPTTYNLER